MDRSDGLPHPTTNEQEILLAILEEVRAIRKGSPAPSEPDPRQLTLPVDEVVVKEPAPDPLPTGVAAALMQGGKNKKKS